MSVEARVQDAPRIFKRRVEWKHFW